MLQSICSQRRALWNKMQLVGLWSLAVVLDALASFSNAQTATPATAPACYALNVSSLPYGGFAYQASLSIPASCTASQFNVSLLFLQGACLLDRDNSANPQCAGEGTQTAGSSSCLSVFSTSAAENFAADVTPGATFDSGQICSPVTTGYVYVQTNCSAFAYSTALNLTTSRYTLGPCLDDAENYSHAAAIGVVCGVLGFILLLILIWALWYKGCFSRRGNHYVQQQDIGMQPYPQNQGPPTYTGFPGQPPPYEAGPYNRPAGQLAGGMAQGTPAYPGPYTGGGFKPTVP